MCRGCCRGGSTSPAHQLQQRSSLVAAARLVPCVVQRLRLLESVASLTV
jgi:hypothetical protein